MFVSFHLINRERKFIVTHLIVILIINITYWRPVPKFSRKMRLSLRQRELEVDGYDLWGEIIVKNG